jgi:hypothetical protein
MDDGSVVLVEIARGTLTRVTPYGKVSVVADLGMPLQVLSSCKQRIWAQPRWF